MPTFRTTANLILALSLALGVSAGDPRATSATVREAPASTFVDVPPEYWAYAYVQLMYESNVTGGCSANPPLYCPNDPVTRAQMALFLLRGIHGGSYAPPRANRAYFDDVPLSYWAVDWIQQLFREGITSGCNPGLFCPDLQVSRAQMAVFLLRAEHGAGYQPPPATGAMFIDVPGGFWSAAWIEQLALEGITAGCAPDLFCPESPVTRAQMAVFMGRTDGVEPLYPEGAININGGPDHVADQLVDLHPFLAGPGTTGQMRFSGDGVNFSAYEPYTGTRGWVLPDASPGAFVRYLPQPDYDVTPAADGQAPDFGLLLSIAELNGNRSSGVAVTTHITQMRVSLDWLNTEPAPGNYNFRGPNDDAISIAEAVGLRVFPIIYIGKGWMNGQPPDAPAKSYPPLDLTTTPDPLTAYSPSYYNFLYAFISHYRGHFDYLAIENEENSGTYWGGTADEYVRVLKTAYKAIHDADPDVRVTNGGFVSSSFGLCIASDWIASGLTTQDEAYAMVVEYSRAAVATGQSDLSTPQAVAYALSQPAVQADCAEIMAILGGAGGAVDVLNFHFYENPEVMHLVPQWYQRRMGLAGYAVPLVSSEMGQRGALEYAPTQRHAADVFRKLITAARLQLHLITWFAADTVGMPVPAPDKVNLFNPDGTRRPAADTFQLVVDTLKDSYRYAATLGEGPTVYRYLFQSVADGSLSLEATWSITSSGQPDPFPTPAGAASASFTSFSRQEFSADVSQGTVTLPGGDGPRTVYARFSHYFETPVYSDTVILDTTPPAGSLVINDGAAYTSSPNVTLTLTATDVTSMPLQMQFSDDDVTYGPLEPFVETRAYTLPVGDGLKTVYVRFLDSAGNVSPVAGASIVLDAAAPRGAGRTSARLNHARRATPVVAPPAATLTRLSV